MKRLIEYINESFKDSKRKYNYFYNERPIPFNNFIKNVPKDWEKEIVDGEYSYGYYRASELDAEE